MSIHPLYPGERHTGAVATVVIGAGHAGLAMSHCLTRRGIDHVVLERGEIANAWRYDRWDSLRLLTPNWQTRLPGRCYGGNDPDGFMTAGEVAGFIAAYARDIQAPVLTGVKVKSVSRDGGGYIVDTNRGRWRTPAVVMASGAFALPLVPTVRAAVPAPIRQLHARHYRNPAQLPEKTVLVIGASASGLQLAEEIHLSGRPVTLAVGEHVRLPRTYRGFDIQYWMDRIGLLDERYDEIDDLSRARGVPSPQLAGSPARNTLDLNRLQERGVSITGKLMNIDNNTAWFSGSLPNICALADLKQQRLLERIDDWVAQRHMDDQLPPPERPAPTLVPEKPLLTLDLSREDIGAIVWATGYAPDHSWLNLPVFDRRGRLQHEGGVVAPGLYAMGLPFMRRRKSSFIHGAEDDAVDLSVLLAGHLDTLASSRSLPATAATRPG